MENIEKVPKYVQERLLEGEKVLAKISAGRANLYATNKRLLRFTSKSTFDVWEYDKISISFQEEQGDVTRIISKFGLYFALFFASVSILLYLGATTITYGSYLRSTTTSTALGLFSTSIFLIGTILALPSDYYQVEHPSFDEKALKEWRINIHPFGTKKVMKFVNVVQEKTRKDKSDYWLS